MDDTIKIILCAICFTMLIILIVVFIKKMPDISRQYHEELTMKKDINKLLDDSEKLWGKHQRK